MLEAPVAKKLRLSNVRAQLQLTQEQLHLQADVSRKVIYNAEHGVRISRISAFAMLKVFNGKRIDIGLPALDIEDLDWKIQGDSE